MPATDPTPAQRSGCGFFYDGDGNLSMMRLVMFVGIVGTLVVWATCCAYKREFIDMPFGMLGLHGMLLTGKMVQNKQENA
jgi:hypothetical protein